MTSYRLPSFRFALTFLLAAFLTVCAAPGAAHAQQHQRAERPRNDLNLPAWSQPSSSKQARRAPSRGGRTRMKQQKDDTPNFPGGPSQAPLGGVEWLAMAGAGYAIRRLRKGRDGDDGEE